MILECANCDETIRWTDRGWVHLDNDDVQCVTAEHCTECGQIVDYYADKKVWLHDDGVFRDGVADYAAAKIEHEPKPETPTIAQPREDK